MLLLLTIHVFRINWILWHIQPGVCGANWAAINIDRLKTETNKFYEDICWYPQITETVFTRFGDDIGAIIMDYCRSIQLNASVLSP